jgi:hypothetical protein
MLGVRHALAGAIGGYQRWISPYKGFHCAHWTLHGGESCSAFGKRMAIEHGLLGFFRGMRARFADCRRSSQALRARRDLLICLASHATPVVDSKADEDASDGEDEQTGKDGKRSSGGWWWADCDFVPSSCDFDLPSCDCSW